MSQVDSLTEAGLKTPKAAAIAGVVFSLLTLASFGLLWSAIPADPQASGAWVGANASVIQLALNLLPFRPEAQGEGGSAGCSGHPLPGSPSERPKSPGEKQSINVSTIDSRKLQSTGA